MIKLRTTPGRLKNARIIPTEHDAAVAHALLRSIDEATPRSFNDGFAMCRFIKVRAIEILRSDFGIDADNGFGEQQ
jgi:hypothetical protein